MRYRVVEDGPDGSVVTASVRTEAEALSEVLALRTEGKAARVVDTEPEFPNVEGCYVSGVHGHYGMAVLMESFGNAAEKVWAHAYHTDPESVDFEVMVDASDALLERWNDSLPDELWVGWCDGEVFVQGPEDDD